MNPELATYKENEDSNIHKDHKIAMIAINMQESYKLSEIELLCAFDMYEEARYERVREHYPNKHVWVDKMRHWIKVSKNHCNEKTEDKLISFATMHHQPWTSEQN